MAVIFVSRRNGHKVGVINIVKYGRPFIWIELMHRPGKYEKGSHARVLHPQDASLDFQEIRVRDNSQGPGTDQFQRES